MTARWRVDSSYNPGVDERGRFRQLEGAQQDMHQRMQDALFRQKYASDFNEEPRRLVSDFDRHFDRLDRDSPSPKRLGQTRPNFHSFEDPGVRRLSAEPSPAQPQFFTMGRSPRTNRQNTENVTLQQFKPTSNSGLFTTRPHNKVVQQTTQSSIPNDGYLPDRSCYVKDENGVPHYKVEFEVGEGFEADNVRVIANGNKITVKVTRLEKDNFSSVTREFTRSVDVPDNVNPKAVKAFFNNGYLILEAPVNPPSAERVLISPDRFRQPVAMNKNVSRSTSLNYPSNQMPPQQQQQQQQQMRNVSGFATSMPQGYNEPKSIRTTTQQSNQEGGFQCTARHPTGTEDRGSFAPSLSRTPSGGAGTKTSSAQISLSQPREKTPPALKSSNTGSVQSYFTQYQQAPPQQQRKEKSPPVGQKFVMEIAIGKDVQPGDIRIHTVNGTVQVSAEWQEERAVGQPVSRRKFQKELDLPEGVDPEGVTAHILEGGKLVLEAPYLPYGLTDV